MRTTFRFERVVSDRLPWTAIVPCLECGNEVVLRRGDVMASLRIGNEVIGVACDGCLTEDSRMRLQQVRQEEAAQR